MSALGDWGEISRLYLNSAAAGFNNTLATEQLINEWHEKDRFGLWRSGCDFITQLAATSTSAQDTDADALLFVTTQLKQKFYMTDSNQQYQLKTDIDDELVGSIRQHTLSAFRASCKRRELQTSASELLLDMVSCLFMYDTPDYRIPEWSDVLQLMADSFASAELPSSLGHYNQLTWALKLFLSIIQRVKTVSHTNRRRVDVYWLMLLRYDLVSKMTELALGVNGNGIVAAISATSAEVRHMCAATWHTLRVYMELVLAIYQNRYLDIGNEDSTAACELVAQAEKLIEHAFIPALMNSCEILVQSVAADVDVIDEICAMQRAVMDSMALLAKYSEKVPSGQLALKVKSTVSFQCMNVWSKLSFSPEKSMLRKSMLNMYYQFARSATRCRDLFTGHPASIAGVICSTLLPVFEVPPELSDPTLPCYDEAEFDRYVYWFQQRDSEQMTATRFIQLLQYHSTDTLCVLTNLCLHAMRMATKCMTNIDQSISRDIMVHVNALQSQQRRLSQIMFLEGVGLPTGTINDEMCVPGNLPAFWSLMFASARHEWTQEKGVICDCLYALQTDRIQQGNLSNVPRHPVDIGRQVSYTAFHDVFDEWLHNMKWIALINRNKSELRLTASVAVILLTQFRYPIYEGTIVQSFADDSADKDDPCRKLSRVVVEGLLVPTILYEQDETIRDAALHELTLWLLVCDEDDVHTTDVEPITTDETAVEIDVQIVDVDTDPSYTKQERIDMSTELIERCLSLNTLAELLLHTMQRYIDNQDMVPFLEYTQFLLRATILIAPLLTDQSILVNTLVSKLYEFLVTMTRNRCLYGPCVADAVDAVLTALYSVDMSQPEVIDLLLDAFFNFSPALSPSTMCLTAGQEVLEDDFKIGLALINQVLSLSRLGPGDIPISSEKRQHFHKLVAKIVQCQFWAQFDDLDQDQATLDGGHYYYTVIEAFDFLRLTISTGIIRSCPTAVHPLMRAMIGASRWLLSRTSNEVLVIHALQLITDCLYDYDSRELGTDLYRRELWVADLPGLQHILETMCQMYRSNDEIMSHVLFILGQLGVLLVRYFPRDTLANILSTCILIRDYTRCSRVIGRRVAAALTTLLFPVKSIFDVQSTTMDSLVHTLLSLIYDDDQQYPRVYHALTVSAEISTCYCFAVSGGFSRIMSEASAEEFEHIAESSSVSTGFITRNRRSRTFDGKIALTGALVRCLENWDEGSVIKFVTEVGIKGLVAIINETIPQDCRPSYYPRLVSVLKSMGMTSMFGNLEY